MTCTIPLTRPYIDADVKAEVATVLDSGYLTEGPKTREFEFFVQKYLSVDHVIAVTNCTVGLEIALRALGIGKGDEVIVPDFTYPATAFAVNFTGATVRLVDIDQSTMLIDYDAVDRAVNKRTKAIIPVSLFGNPLDYRRLNAIKEQYGLFIIEDAACALGSEYAGRKTGSLADITVFSLHPRKFITTGEGGLICTNQRDWADWMRAYKHFGIQVDKTTGQTAFSMLGGNFKLSDIQAVIGLCQMRKVNYLLDQRRLLADSYRKLLNNVAGVSIPETTSNGLHSYQSFCTYTKNRNKIIQSMREQNIECQIGTYALSMQPALRSNPLCIPDNDLQNSHYAFDHCLTLPLYHDMTQAEQQKVIDELQRQINAGGAPANEKP